MFVCLCPALTLVEARPRWTIEVFVRLYAVCICVRDGGYCWVACMRVPVVRMYGMWFRVSRRSARGGVRVGGPCMATSTPATVTLGSSFIARACTECASGRVCSDLARLAFAVSLLLVSLCRVRVVCTCFSDILDAARTYGTRRPPALSQYSARSSPAANPADRQPPTS